MSEAPRPDGDMPFTRLDATAPEQDSWWRWVLDLDPFAPAVGRAARRDGRWAGTGPGDASGGAADGGDSAEAAVGPDQAVPDAQSDRPTGAT